MFERHVLVLVIPHILKYDFTLKSAGVDTTENNTQQALNIHAGLAVIGIGRLGGYFPSPHTNTYINRFDPAAPVHEEMRVCISALLTPAIANMICRAPMEEFLKDVNSNVETPFCVWNNATRQELVQFLESHTPGASSTGIVISLLVSV